MYYCSLDCFYKDNTGKCKLDYCVNPSFPTYPRKDYVYYNIKFSNNPCNYCSSNPRNGGSGLCNCTLGDIKWS